MNSIRKQVTVGLICLLLGVMLVVQFRSQEAAREGVPQSATDQATYISWLYDSTADLRGQVGTLQSELDRYQKESTGGKSSLDGLTRDLQNLRIADGAVDVTGPGVTVLVDGDVTVFEMQDLVNELRDASAEAIAVNGVRIVTRSAIVAGQGDGSVTIDRQPLMRPYKIEAIGNPDTLVPALERKGGLIALLKAGDPNLKVDVTGHSLDDKAGWVKLPKTTADFQWSDAQAGQ